MRIPTKTLMIVAGAVITVGAVTAVVLGGTRARREVTVPAGTELVAALEQTVSTARNHPGDAIALRTVESIPVAPNEEVPAGAVIHGSVAEAKRSGRIAGAPELSLRFTDLEVDGERHPISAQSFYVTGRNDAGKR
jgi:hypothetical protein